MLARVEATDDRPALGEVAELAEGAEVAQEVGSLVRRLQAEQRVDQLVDISRAPVFHRSPGPL